MPDRTQHHLLNHHPNTPLLAAAGLWGLLLGGCCHTPAHPAHGGTQPAATGGAHTANNNGHAHHAGHPQGGHQGGHQHGMRHRFRDPAVWSAVFDDPKRDAWQKPEAVIELLGLAPNASVADIGAGTGYFSVRFAHQLAQGIVYAIDVERSLVEHIRKRVAKAGLGKRVIAVEAGAAEARIPAPVDLIFLCNTYHHISARTRYFQALAARLKPGGRLAIVEFRGGKLPVGPPEKARILPAQLDAELRLAGYERARLDTKTLPYQYIAVYRPSSATR